MGSMCFNHTLVLPAMKRLTRQLTLQPKLFSTQQFPTYLLMTLNHPSNVKYMLDGKIIGMLFLPPTSLNQSRKTQKSGTHLTSSTDARKLPSQDAESDIPSQPTLFSSTKTHLPPATNATPTSQYNISSRIAQSTGTQETI